MLIVHRRGEGEKGSQSPRFDRYRRNKTRQTAFWGSCSSWGYRRRSGSLEDFGDFFFGDRAFFNYPPVGLRHIDRGRAGASGEAAVQHQIDAAVHHAEAFYATGA